MVKATNIDAFSLALTIIANRAFALVVVLAVTAWILILSNSHRLFALGLLPTLFDLRSLIVYSKMTII
jgi:hypothetical protein